MKAYRFYSLDTDSDAWAGVALHRARAVLLITLILLAVLLGGGDEEPAIGLVIELVGTALLLATFVDRVPEGSPLPAIVKAVLVIGAVIPAVQLIPVPFGWWADLPGRAFAAAIQEAAQATDGTHQLSLDPEATRAAGVFLVPGFAAVLATARADPLERRRLAMLITALALASALLGVTQIATGAGYLRPTPHEGTATGFFTNRNHQADLLLCGMAFVAALGTDRIRSRGAALFAAGLVVLLALCEITTTSRMGTTLLLPELAVAALILFAQAGRTGWIAVGVGVALVGALVLIALTNPVVQSTLARFHDLGQDDRYSFWTGTLVAIHRYWPWGSGLGTFVPVYASVEDLDSVSFFFANHAHNDYLELLLEVGAAAILLFAAYLAVLLYAARFALRGSGWQLRAAALAAIITLLIHSAVDFPLRTFALSVIFGVLNGLVLPLGSTRPPLTRRAVRTMQVLRT